MVTKRWAKLSVVAASVAVLAACNPAAQQAPAPAGEGTVAPGGGTEMFSTELSGTMKTSGFNPSDEVGLSRSDLATEKVAPVTVEMDTTNFDPQKFAAQVASGQTPDLIQVNRSTIGTLADRELIMPLDECYATWDRDESYFYDAAIEDVTYDGQLYGIPQFFQAAMIIGNKNVMEPAGVSVEDLDTSDPAQLVEAATAMYQGAGGNPTVIGFDPDLPGSAATWITIFGGQTMDENGMPTLDEAANVEAVTWMKEIMDAQGGFASFKSFKDTMDVFGDQNQYVQNQVGAQTWAQWYINVLSNTKDEVSLVAAPLRTRDGDVLGMAGGTTFAIPAGAQNPSAACAWAIHATSLEAWEAAGAARAETVQEKNSINTGLFTASPEADELVREKFVVPSGNADFDQLIETSYEALENTRSAGGSAVGQEITDALGNAVSQVLAGTAEPEAALAEAQATAMRAWDQSAIAQR